MLRRLTPVRFVPFWLRVTFAIFGASGLAWGETTTEGRVARSTDEFWNMATVNPDADLHYDIECDILYYNPTWRIMWVQSGDRGEYADPGNSEFPFKSGDRVRFRGSLKAPINDMRLADAITEVVGKAVSQPQKLPGGNANLNPYRNALVTFEAWVDKQDIIDNGVLRLSLSQEGRAILAMVTLDDLGAARALVDRRLRVTGVFAPKIDPAGNLTELQVMVPGIGSLEPIGFVADDPRFEAPIRLIEEIASRPSGDVVRLSAEVIAHNVGQSITVRDRSGQIELPTQQIRYVNAGEMIEVVGTATISGETPTLTAVSFRTIASARAKGPFPQSASRLLLNLAGQVRELPESETTAGHVATLRGVVTWSTRDTTRFFLADSSGGIEIERSPDSPYYGPGAMLDIRGSVDPGDFAPIVRASQIFPLGTMAYPRPKTVDLEHVLSGVEDAQWVSMQGYVFNTSRENGICTLEVSTNQGDFKIRVPSENSLKDLLHAIVEAQGVCATQANANRQLEQVELWVPEQTLITRLENAPEDPFAQPELALDRLGRFNPGREIRHFVKVAGTVLIHQDDQWLYIAEGDQVLHVHTRSPDLQPAGRRIEVAGRLGRENGRIVLREALIRPVGDGALPDVKSVEAATENLGNFEGHRIAITGKLINRLVTHDHVRLTVQNGSTVVDADLSNPSRSRFEHELPELGAQLELTGILVPAPGTAGAKTGGFSLSLGTLDDIKVLSPAPWWSPGRLLVVTVALVLIIGLSFLWVRVLRRRVQQQTALITEQMTRESRMSEQIQHATRLESLGLLAGGIAHDFNNLLTVVLGNVSLLRLDAAPGSQTDHSLSDAERAVGRAQQLTLQLLTFAKGGSPVRNAEDLPGIIREVTQFATHGSNVRCNLSLASDAWPAHVDKGQIGQVVQNLVINAVQAMPTGGSLSLRLVNEQSTIELPGHLPPGRYLRLDVTDTGHGIPAASISRIFDPYFSTKDEGHGLGLATVYSVVRKHHGDIQVQSIEGHGTTFSLWLPAADDASSKAVPTESRKIPRGNGEAILVMDDESDIRILAMKMLQQIGYQAAGVAHGYEALEVFQEAQKAGRPFKAVILDLTIRGGMGGVETLRSLRMLDPDLKAIVSSGYASDQTIATHHAHGFDDLIPKPYEIARFARTLHRTLQGAPAKS